MKKLLLLTLTLSFPGLSMSAAETAKVGVKPNVVVVLADDIGLGDIGFYHRERTGRKEVIPTPHIDQLIRKGVRFSNAHVNALCAPTRYAMMTGNYTFRCHQPWGVWSAYEPSAVQPGQKTLGHCMQEAGYATAFLGKWHLGGRWHVRGSDKVYEGSPFGLQTDTVDAAQRRTVGFGNIMIANRQWVVV